jgi:hypothetical protein
MSVIVHASDGERLHTVLASDAAHIRPESRQKILGNGRQTVLGREDAMVKQAGECVIGHGGGHCIFSRPCRDWCRFFRKPGSSCRAIIIRAYRRLVRGIHVVRWSRRSNSPMPRTPRLADFKCNGPTLICVLLRQSAAKYWAKKPGGQRPPGRVYELKAVRTSTALQVGSIAPG